MNLEFAIHVIATLLMFKPAATTQPWPYTPGPWYPWCVIHGAGPSAHRSRSTSYVADWWVSLDRQGWSVCPKINTYLRGFMRSDRLQGVERVGRLEEGRCRVADEPIYATQPAACSNGNWSSTLNGWVVRKVEISIRKKLVVRRAILYVTSPLLLNIKLPSKVINHSSLRLLLSHD